ncbi:MAG: class I SAM-dependent methyltransferase [Burkholderiales bacterium]|nr:MAG: class I SAM-dependent methyltransferase [Burkholderiales bacterium]
MRADSLPVKSEPVEQIYAKPDAYDLEHSANEPDIGFFVRLARRFQPARILEVACGNGRVTIPVAAAAAEWRAHVTGLELSSEMLDSARSKDGAARVEWLEGDIRSWKAPEPYELIISPCASMSHLLTLEDQLAAWRCTYSNLSPGGRFIVAEVMANFPVLAESMQIPPRVALEMDADRISEETHQRLLRYRTTRYHAHEQSATVHFLYDQFSGGDSDNPERFLSDYESHVYFPRELQLLFIAAGFEVEHVWGNYGEAPLGHSSRQIIVCGRRPLS